MKKVLKVLLILLGAVAVLIAAFCLFLLWASRQPAVPSGYYENILPDKPLEQAYTAKGGSEAVFVEYDAGDEKIGSFRIWYPAELEDTNQRYPIVVMANGTGVPSSKYEAIFEHLASWGFVVMGNEDESSWDGVSSAKSLDYLLALNSDSASIFYEKLNPEKIGIAGHSQGGVGAINAVTAQENGSSYTSLYTASITWPDLAAALEWSYDLTGLSIPYFFVAGTGEADSETISPLEAMERTFEQLDTGALTVMARRKDTDHGEMLANADGYMTAWFCYTLQGDMEAANVFLGESPELLENTTHWQDVHIKGLD